MKLIHKYRSKNYNNRKKTLPVEYIIIHYTAIKKYEDAINHLCNLKNKVSSHFLINKKGIIYNLVDTDKRAWHAGKSYWNDKTDINSRSIGIELDYLGKDLKNEKYDFKQILALKKLLKILSKKFHINNKNVLGHSDIAPYRKIDPGKNFPWKELALQKLVYFPKKLNISQKKKLEAYFNLNFIKRNKKFKILYMMDMIGYDVGLARHNSKNYYKLIKSYQMHFDQKNVSGIEDAKTFNLICSHYYSCIDLCENF